MDRSFLHKIEAKKFFVLVFLNISTLILEI